MLLGVASPNLAVDGVFHGGKNTSGLPPQKKNLSRGKANTLTENSNFSQHRSFTIIYVVRKILVAVSREYRQPFGQYLTFAYGGESQRKNEL